MHPREKLHFLKMMSWQCWLFSILLFPLYILTGIVAGPSAATIPLIFFAVTFIAGLLFKYLHDWNTGKQRKLDSKLKDMAEEVVEETDLKARLQETKRLDKTLLDKEVLLKNIEDLLQDVPIKQKLVLAYVQAYTQLVEHSDETNQLFQLACKKWPNDEVGLVYFGGLYTAEVANKDRYFAQTTGTDSATALRKLLEINHD